MPTFLALLAFAAIILGGITLTIIKSDIQIIIALLFFGFGFVFLALAAALNRLDKLLSPQRDKLQATARVEPRL